MKLFNQEILRVILLDTRYRQISTVEITRGTINESLAGPREILRLAIAFLAYGFVLVQQPSKRRCKPFRSRHKTYTSHREAARILQIHFLDHVIAQVPSMQEASLRLCCG